MLTAWTSEKAIQHMQPETTEPPDSRYSSEYEGNYIRELPFVCAGRVPFSNMLDGQRADTGVV